MEHFPCKRSACSMASAGTGLRIGALPSPVDEYCLSQESTTLPQRIPHTVSSVLLQEGGGSHITPAATLLVSVPFVTE